MTSLNIQDPSNACLVADFYHGNSVDFGKLFAARWNGLGCPAVIMKCSQGSTYADPLYAQRLTQALATGFQVAPYAFNTGDPVVDQVNEFLTHAHIVDGMGCWLDFEDNRASEMTLAAAIEFMDRCDQATGRTCGMYSGDRLKTTITSATDTQREFLAGHAFWLAEYGNVAVMKDDNGKQLPWDVPFLWQFTDGQNGPTPHTLDGLGSASDLSIFNGSPDQLRAAWPLPVIPTS